MSGEVALAIKAAISAAAKAKESKPFRYFLIGCFCFALVPLFPLLFFILFITGAGNSSTTSATTVETYRVDVMQIASKYNMDDYVDLILAVMQQESGGKGNDPMQASESGYNTKYPRKPNGITDPKYSIECGIQALKNCLKLAGVQGPDDMENISLALQGYNFGSGFISFAKANGGYSIENAEKFSKDKATELGWKSYGDTNYVEHVLRYYNPSKEGKLPIFDKVKEIGESLLNTPYELGANNPGVAMDCSSFVCYVYTKAGKNMPRTTAQGIYDKYCTPISKEDVKAGDLIFFTKTYDCENVISHVGIYCGHGVMLEEGGTHAQYANCNDEYWKGHFYAYGRVK